MRWERLWKRGRHRLSPLGNQGQTEHKRLNGIIAVPCAWNRRAGVTLVIRDPNATRVVGSCSAVAVRTVEIAKVEKMQIALVPSCASIAFRIFCGELN